MAATLLAVLASANIWAHPGLYHRGTVVWVPISLVVGITCWTILVWLFRKSGKLAGVLATAALAISLVVPLSVKLRGTIEEVGYKSMPQTGLLDSIVYFTEQAILFVTGITSRLWALVLILCLPYVVGWVMATTLRGARVFERIAGFAHAAGARAGNLSGVYVMSGIGAAIFVGGIYFLVFAPGHAQSEVVNLQRLAIGQTFTVVGAVLLAVALRPR